MTLPLGFLILHSMYVNFLRFFTAINNLLMADLRNIVLFLQESCSTGNEYDLIILG